MSASSPAAGGMKRQGTANKVGKSGRFLTRGSKKHTSHVHLAQSFESSAFNLFTVKGSAMLSKPVLTRSIAAASMSQVYYVVNEMRPDNRLENVGSFYFIILGSCLSFLVVFKSNMAYSRFWEARGHIGAICNHSRSLMRRVLFSTDLRPGNGEVEEAVDTIQRYLRAFFILMMQDVRMTQDLVRIPADILTDKEKDDLVGVRRRPLMCLGWAQMKIRALVRGGHITERMSMRMEDHIESMSQAYHGCTKIRSQPMPFSYSQLIAMLTLIYCFSVPITFITSFSYGICVPTFVMALVYFGINHVGTELSDPFGHDTNDIHLEAFMRQIDEDLGTYIMHWTLQPPLPKTEPPPPVVAVGANPSFDDASNPATPKAKPKAKLEKSKSRSKLEASGKSSGGESKRNANTRSSAPSSKGSAAEYVGTDTERGADDQPSTREAKSKSKSSSGKSSKDRPKKKAVEDDEGSGLDLGPSSFEA